MTGIGVTGHPASGAPGAQPASVDAFQAVLAGHSYVADPDLATAIYLPLAPGNPLLLIPCASVASLEELAGRLSGFGRSIRGRNPAA